MKWLILVAVVAFIAAQIVRMRPSARDKQLQVLRQAAARAGLLVRFWTARSSGYTVRGLPDSGFCYTLGWQRGDVSHGRWAVWLSVEGDRRKLSGTPPEIALEWLAAFQRQFPASWALLESTDAGLSVLWQERGTEKDIQGLAEALRLLEKTLKNK